MFHAYLLAAEKSVLTFIDKGLTTWLNGSTMFCPKAIDVIYPAIIHNQTDIINYYIENIEKPFFNYVVNKYGWHVSHKAACEFLDMAIVMRDFLILIYQVMILLK